jgi:hypothetical protein
VARLQNAFFSQGVFLQDLRIGAATFVRRESPTASEREFSLTNYGGALGVKLTDRLAVGAGVSLYDFGFETVVGRQNLLAGNFFAPADASGTPMTSALSGDDVSLSFNGGALWMPWRSLHVGASFRRGPRFGFAPAVDAFDEDRDFSGDIELKVPDVWGAGVKWLPLKSERLRLTGDISRVNYSQLRKDFVDDQARALGKPNQLLIDDGVELRAGCEYQFGDTHIVIPRIGLWRDPDHAVRFVPSAAFDDRDDYFSAVLPRGEPVMHYTFGVGVVWSELFEVHLGSDLSSQSKLLTMSFVARFKRTGAVPTP